VPGFRVIARDYDAPMLRTREEGNSIKGFRLSKCPNHLGGCYTNTPLGRQGPPIVAAMQSTF